MADKSWKTGGKSNPGKIDTELRDKLDADLKLLKIGEELKRLKAENRVLKKDLVTIQEREAFQDQLRGKGKVNIWLPRKRIGKTRDKSPTAALAVLSDWHVEERVDKDSVNQFNEYTPAIAERRAKRIFQKVGDYIEWFTPGAEVLYLGLLGDFINGFIHQEYVQSNHLSPIEATRFAKRLIIGGIEYLRKRKVVKKIICPTAIGNHGRINEKMDFGMACKNSYEWGMYSDLFDLYEHDPFVDILVCYGYCMFTNIFGRVVRWHHGDGMKGGVGMGGISGPAEKKIFKWNTAPIAAELDLFGHLHCYTPNKKWVLNGSLIGYNVYGGKTVGDYTEPSQAFIGFSKSRGMFLNAEMYAEEAAEKPEFLAGMAV